jgi:hypothetical protein
MRGQPFCLRWIVRIHDGFADLHRSTQSLNVIQQDAEAKEAYRAMNEPLLHKLFDDAKAADNKLAGYKLAVSLHPH